MLLSTPIWLVAGAAMLVLPFLVRSPLAVLLVPLGVFGIATISAQWLMFASRVTVSEEGVAGTSYAGIMTRITWSDVSRIESIAYFAFDCSRFVRVVGRHAWGGITFTDAMVDFDELITLIEERATHAERRPLPVMWRFILFGGIGGKWRGSSAT